MPQPCPREPTKIAEGVLRGVNAVLGPATPRTLLYMLYVCVCMRP